MIKNTITKEQIDKLIAEAKIDISTVQEKCTVVTVTLKSGFILSESSACVDKDNYNEQIGVRCCMERIEKKLWELEGYALQKALTERKADVEPSPKERVKIELDELKAKGKELAAVVWSSEARNKFNACELYLLEQQLIKMKGYENILEARLAVWREIK